MEEEMKSFQEFAGLGAIGGGLARTKTFAQELIEVIDTKNSWGKNELKEELLKILAKRHSF